MYHRHMDIISHDESYVSVLYTGKGQGIHIKDPTKIRDDSFTAMSSSVDKGACFASLPFFLVVTFIRLKKKLF